MRISYSFAPPGASQERPAEQNGNKKITRLLLFLWQAGYFMILSN